MDLEQRPEQLQEPRPEQLAKLAQAQLAKEDYIQEREAYGVENLPEEEPKESHELEDIGDSPAALDGEEALSPFDREWLEPPPLVSHLPRRARPTVLYRIDEHFAVHPLGRQEGWFSNLRYLIACAIAKHLQESRSTLSTVGDWCNVPTIGRDENVLALVSSEVRKNLKKELKRRGAALKAFAILLPSGDVITPQALLGFAQEGKRATRAAALRLAALKPTELAGESWSNEAWDQFERTQRIKERRRAGTQSQGRS
ncbi:MAG: hypothetical protein V3S55_15800 [Nitrospiraceae bacterium]